MKDTYNLTQKMHNLFVSSLAYCRLLLTATKLFFITLQILCEYAPERPSTLLVDIDILNLRLICMSTLMYLVVVSSASMHIVPFGLDVKHEN